MKVTDPVCGMSVDSDKAAANERYEGQTYYFCSTHCRDSFKADPTRYAGRASSGGGAGNAPDHGAGHHH